MCTEVEVRTGLVEPWLTIVAGDCEKEQGLFAFLGGKYTIPKRFMGSNSGRSSIASKMDKVTKEIFSKTGRLPLLYVPFFPRRKDCSAIFP